MHALANRIFTRYPNKSLRFLEIIPPFTSIFLISMPFWGAIFFPVQLAYFILFFNTYWLYKSVNLAVTVLIASRKIKKAEKENWLVKAKELRHFEKINHVAIIPTYKESIEKLKETIESIKSQTFPIKNIHIVMAFEAREEEAKEKASILKKEYEGLFGSFNFSFHPDLPNEVKGKSSNQAYAGKLAQKLLIDSKKIDVNFATIASVDADCVFDSQLYSYVTYEFLKSDNPYYNFYQSATVYYNNFWDIPSFTRIIAFFGSLWRISLLVQNLRLITHSTYVLSFKLMRDIGYWDTDVVPEDYRIFFKAFFATGGKVSVVPIFLKTSMDSPKSPTYRGSLMNKYSQERRWSWGISDDAVYLRWWLTVKEAPFFKKTYLVWNVILDHILWPVNWYIITISANLIVLLNPVFSRTNLGYSLPRVSGFILTLCLIALFILMLVDYDMRGKKYRPSSRFRQFVFPLEFVLMPISGFFLSSLPALISHIQLILGKRLEYKVTEKS